MYAIVRAGGHQEKVQVGDVLTVNRVLDNGQPAEQGAVITLPVKLIVDGDTVTSDADTLASATVTAEVVEHSRGPKIDILKYKNKTGYRRRLGHRQAQTTIKVTAIETGK